MMQGAIAKIKELQAVTGANQKQEILRRYKDDEDFCKLLYYALNPMLTYKISEQTMNQPVQYNPAVTWCCAIFTPFATHSRPAKPWMMPLSIKCALSWNLHCRREGVL